MGRMKIDNRIRVLIENGVKTGHRSMFIIVGQNGKDQVGILHHMLASAEVKARPSILWCYKKDLGFTSHRKKRIRRIQKKVQSGMIDFDEDDPFELFLAATKIRFCYYSETDKILGNTFGMCVLQDFEALTPNLLARTIETVEGGGIILLLLKSINSLKQLYTLSMDVHTRFRTEAHQNVVGRFNERFILSLADCLQCIVMDDSLNIIPLSENTLSITPCSKSENENDSNLCELKQDLKNTEVVKAIIGDCKTYDQSKAVLKFIDVISEKSLNGTVALTAARGRGKSAALGLSVSAAIAFGYSNIYVTSPSPENLGTLFEFVFKGFDSLKYQEHTDYDIIHSTNPEFNKAVVRINFFREHRQIIQYIHPSEAHKLSQAELLVIDEAAAIPLPLVKSLFGPYLIFLSSTINGYEGTGRSLSLKLIQQIRSQSSSKPDGNETNSAGKVSGRTLHEMTLDESIRYKPGDHIEQWLANLLCLDATLTPQLTSGCPPPRACELYYINRDTLFSYHKASEAFLQRIMSLYVASHYKNSPNDLQMLSDAPAHHLFCLLGPIDPNKKSLPEVLTILQVCLEGEISKVNVTTGLTRGQRASGDMIPWTIAQQYQDEEFPSLCGARIIRIATHPDYQGMGYGSRAIDLLEKYYEQKFLNLDENVSKSVNQVESLEDEDISQITDNIAPKKNLPPLLLKLNERPAEYLHYLGVSYGLTLELLKFWKKAGFVPVYLRQTSNDLTGEHSCIMLKLIKSGDFKDMDTSWLKAYWTDFRRRFISLLSFQFGKFSPSLGLSLLQNKNQSAILSEDLNPQDLRLYLTKYDIKRLDMYSKNLVDYHLIMDLVPILSRLFFLHKMGDLHISPVQSAMMLGLGLQHKSVDDLSKELDLPSSQLLGLFNKTIRRMCEYIKKIFENEVEKQLYVQDTDEASAKYIPLVQDMRNELEEMEKEIGKKQASEKKRLLKDDFSQYAIKGTDEEWSNTLTTEKISGSVSVKIGEKRLQDSVQDSEGKKKNKMDRKGNFDSSKNEGTFGKGWKKKMKGGGGGKWKK